MCLRSANRHRQPRNKELKLKGQFSSYLQYNPLRSEKQGMVNPLFSGWMLYNIRNQIMIGYRAMDRPPEFPRLIATEGIIQNKNKVEKIEATVAECAALAKRLDLRSLSGLKGKISMFRVLEDNVIRIEGDIEADVVQSCVVSLQDVPSKVKVHFNTCFTEEGKEIDEDDEISVSLEEGFPDVMKKTMAAFFTGRILFIGFGCLPVVIKELWNIAILWTTWSIKMKIKYMIQRTILHESNNMSS